MKLFRIFYGSPFIGSVCSCYRIIMPYFQVITYYFRLVKICKVHAFSNGKRFLIKPRSTVGNIPSILIYGQSSSFTGNWIKGLFQFIKLSAVFIDIDMERYFSLFNEIKRSMENADADVYLWNYEELPDNKNYDSSIAVEIPYGISPPIARNSWYFSRQ